MDSCLALSPLGSIELYINTLLLPEKRAGHSYGVYGRVARSPTISVDMEL
jgi:hypothetical protein